MTRPKAGFRSASNEMYGQFLHAHPGTSMSKAQYRSIIYTFNNLLLYALLEHGHRLKLPHGLGELAIAKYKPKRYKFFTGKDQRPGCISGLPINWKQTRQHKKLIYHLNAHTDGYRFRWKWFGSGARFEYSQCFTFRACRNASRSLARFLKSDPQYAQRYRQWPDK